MTVDQMMLLSNVLLGLMILFLVVAVIMFFGFELWKAWQIVIGINIWVPKGKKKQGEAASARLNTADMKKKKDRASGRLKPAESAGIAGKPESKKDTAEDKTAVLEPEQEEAYNSTAVLRAEEPEAYDSTAVLRAEEPEAYDSTVVLRPEEPEAYDSTVVLRPEEPEAYDSTVVLRPEQAEKIVIDAAGTDGPETRSGQGKLELVVDITLIHTSVTI